MTILDEIKTMQEQGKPEAQISQELQQKGFSQQEISNAISQTQIKDAISSPAGPANTQSFQASQIQPPEPPMTASESLAPQSQYQTQESTTPQQPQLSTTESFSPPTQQFQTQTLPPTQDSMQPSLLNAPQTSEALTPGQTQEIQTQNYTDQAYPQAQDGYDYYPQDQYQSPISSDTITEISEQVVSEKLSSIKKHLEKNIDMKNTFEAKISHVDERLQRIEKIIDRLQLSILQKVGDYATSVTDLKKELIETQKSFTKAIGKSHSKTKKKK